MQHRRASIRLTLAVAGGAMGLALAACSGASATLGDIEYPATPPIVTSEPAVATLPPDACPGSFRASPSGRDLFGTWWRVRPDSSGILMAGRSTDGGRTWSAVTPADTLDASRRGCNRPAPAIYADSATDYVDIVYFLEPKDGPGVFYTHSMDGRQLGSGDGIFHSPVVIMYGERPSRASVTALGDDVAVAYEDPNATRPAVGLALSRTMGHIFETRMQASVGDLPAHDPLVALSRDSVTVQWAERPDTVTSGGRIAVRRGKWR
jgi:hypothetical protein